jgi:hypothetical protein
MGHLKTQLDAAGAVGHLTAHLGGQTSLAPPLGPLAEPRGPFHGPAGEEIHPEAPGRGPTAPEGRPEVRRRRPPTLGGARPAPEAPGHRAGRVACFQGRCTWPVAMKDRPAVPTHGGAPGARVAAALTPPT